MIRVPSGWLVLSRPPKNGGKQPYRPWYGQSAWGEISYVVKLIDFSSLYTSVMHGIQHERGRKKKP